VIHFKRRKELKVKKAATIFAAAALAATGVAACGSSDNKSSDSTAAATESTASTGASTGGAATTLAVSADPSGALKFNTDKLTAKAGKVTIDFDNPATLSHDVVVQDQSGNEVTRTDLIAQSKASTTAELKPGTYTFFCDVPGHKEGGMQGTLTVQ
jgi:plastocyanin